MNSLGALFLPLCFQSTIGSTLHFQHLFVLGDLDSTLVSLGDFKTGPAAPGLHCDSSLYPSTRFVKRQPVPLAKKTRVPQALLFMYALRQDAQPLDRHLPTLTYSGFLTVAGIKNAMLVSPPRKLKTETLGILGRVQVYRLRRIAGQGKDAVMVNFRQVGGKHRSAGHAAHRGAKNAGPARWRDTLGMLLGALLAAISLCAQSSTGELHLKVTDPAGLGVQSAVEVISDANQVRRTLTTDDNGNAVAERLPFGIYKIRVARRGFVIFSESFEIRSVLPTPFRIKLTPATVNASVIVKDVGTLIDPHRVGDINRIGSSNTPQRVTAATTPPLRAATNDNAHSELLQLLSPYLRRMCLRVTGGNPT